MIRDINEYIRNQRENNYKDGVSNFDEVYKVTHSLYEDVCNLIALKVYCKDYTILNNTLTGELFNTEVNEGNYNELFSKLKDSIIPKYFNVISKRLGYDEVLSYVNEGNKLLESVNELNIEGLNITDEDTEDKLVTKKDLKYFSYGNYLTEEDKKEENELKYVTNYYKDSEIELKVEEGGLVVIRETDKPDNVIVINPLRLDMEVIIDVMLLDTKFTSEDELGEKFESLEYGKLVDYVYTLTANQDNQIEESYREYFSKEEEIKVKSEEEEVNLDFEWKLNNLRELEKGKDNVDDNGEIKLNVLLKDKSQVEHNDKVITKMLDKIEQYTELVVSKKEEFVRLNKHHVASVIVTIVDYGM